MDYSFKYYLKDCSLFFTNSWSSSTILNRTSNIFPAPAPDCHYPAGLTSWSVTILLNRTSPNILPLCKVIFPGSLHPLILVTPSSQELGLEIFFLKPMKNVCHLCMCLLIFVQVLSFCPFDFHSTSQERAAEPTAYQQSICEGIMKPFS